MTMDYNVLFCPFRKQFSKAYKDIDFMTIRRKAEKITVIKNKE